MPITCPLTSCLIIKHKAASNPEAPRMGRLKTSTKSGSKMKKTRKKFMFMQRKI
jgi:hypothetical protein